MAQNFVTKNYRAHSEDISMQQECNGHTDERIDGWTPRPSLRQTHQAFSCRTYKMSEIAHTVDFGWVKCNNESFLVNFN